jgi:hypothetical protein
LLRQAAHSSGPVNGFRENQRLSLVEGEERSRVSRRPRYCAAQKIARNE